MKKILIVLFLIIMLVSCTRNIDNNSARPAEISAPIDNQVVNGNTNTVETPTDITPSAGATDQIGRRVVEMTSTDFAFSPLAIKVKEGDEVILNIKNMEGDHGIAIPAFGVNAKLGENTQTSVTFVADKKGEYPFYCNVPCGSGHKLMRGTLIVE